MHVKPGAGLAQATPTWKKPALSAAEGPALGTSRQWKVTQRRLFHGGAAHPKGCCPRGEMCLGGHP